MGYTAVSDRILIIQDPPKPLQERAPWTGTIHSVGRSCKDVKEGDRIVYAPGNHPVHGEFQVIRSQQVYAIINGSDSPTS